MTRRSIGPVLLGLAAIGAVTAVAVASPWSTLGHDDGAEQEAVRDRSEIGLTALTTDVETEGELTFTSQRAVLASWPGVVTWVAEVGTDLEWGSPVFEIDGRPSIALLGAVPAWRTLDVGDVGPDVE